MVWRGSSFSVSSENRTWQHSILVFPNQINAPASPDFRTIALYELLKK